MQVSVVGATGLVGGALVAALRDRGDGVVPVSRGGDTVGGVPGVAWDPADGPPPRAVTEVDAIVNLAGAGIGDSRWSDERKRVIRDSRVDTTRALADALASGGARVLVNASAVGYYGSGERSVDESAPPGSDFLADLCVDWEEAAMGAAPHGVRVVLLRTAGMVLDADGGALQRMLLPFKLGLGGPMGGGGQWWTWIHVDDEVGLIVHALDTESVRGPVNAVAPGTVRQREFASTLGRVLGRPAFLPAPGFALHAVLGEMATMLLDGQYHVLPDVARESGYTFLHPDLEPALRDLVG